MNKTNTSSLMNKILLSNTISYENTSKYTTFYQVLGSETQAEPGLGTSSSSGTLSFASRAALEGTSAARNYTTSIPAANRADATEVYTYLRDQIASSGLNNYVPADGAKYGIDGSPASWANFLTNLAYIESGFKNTAVGDVGVYEGGSNGLFQLSPNDALNYKLQDKAFSIQQLQDPKFNMDVTIKIATSLVKKSGVIALGGQGMARYWGPLQRGWVNPRDQIYAGFSPSSKPIVTDNVNKSAEIAWEFTKTKVDPNPINAQAEFYTAFDNSYKNDLDNYQIYDYAQRWGVANDITNGALTTDVFTSDIYNSPNWVFGPQSDVVGFWATNTFNKFTDSVAPVFDFNNLGITESSYVFDPVFYNTEFGGPYYLANLDSKVPGSIEDLINSSSDVTKAIENASLANIFKPDSSTNLYEGAGQDTATSLDLSSDLPSYLAFNDNQEVYLDSFKSQFPTMFEYITYFGTVNNTPGYNPRDYRSKNLEKMNDFYFDINVEGKIQTVDLLQRKYKHSISRRSIKKSLCVNTVAATNNKENTVTTDTINKTFLNQRALANTGLTSSTVSTVTNNKTFASFTDKAASAITTANKFLSMPQQQVAELSVQINKLGISNLPGAQMLTAPIQGILGSASELTSIVKSPLNLPSVLPSVDPGSFPQIAGLLLNTNWKQLDINSAIGIAQQLNTIYCDFRLPVIGKVDFGNLTDINVGDFGDGLEKLLQGIGKKFEKSFNDISKKIKNLVPDFIKNVKQFFKNIFTCNNKPNIKDSANPVK